MPAEKFTHYCDWDAPGKRTVQAICGEQIRRRDHANDPTCPRCQQGLAARAAIDAKESSS